MEGRLLNRRNDAKERRKTLRHSVLEEKRKTALSSSDTTPETEDRPGPSLRNRAANRAVKARPEAAGQLQERKARQARTAKEVLKVRPPFNNYIRVKHTGLSPFRSYQDASKRSKVAPWRAPPPKVLLPSSSGCQAEATGRQKKANAAPSQPDPTGRGKPAPGTSQLPIPRSNIAAGVVLFGTGAHNTAKSVFKPPAKIQPIPFSTRPNRTKGNKMELEKEIPPKSIPAKKLSPKKPRLVKKPVPKLTVKQMIPIVVEQPMQSSRTTRVATIKPQGMKKPPNQIDQKKEVKPPPKRVSRRPVEASSRVLRSSQVPGQDDKENLPSDNRSIVVAKKSQRERSLNLAGSSGNAVPVIAPPAEERTKGLEERSAQLAKETDRLRNLADEWSSLKSTLSLPTSIADEIDSITGQTMLLISKKFIQYKNLIEGAYTEMRTTLEDLDGFWEMVYIQVRQLDDRYKGLNDMKEKNWNTKSPKLFKNVQIRERKSSRPSKKKTSNVKSNFQKFLAEKLKKKEEFVESTSIEQPMENKLESQCVRTCESPLLDMSVDEPFETPKHSFNVTQRGSATPRSTPRALENARRASKSIRFSTTMMRLSTLFQDNPTS